MSEVEMSPIQKVFAAASRIFNPRGAPVTPVNLKELAALMNYVTKSELKLSSALLDEREQSESDPPVTYMPVHEDEVLSVGVFIVRKGKHLPLHNHPNMHGLIKVLHGEISIISYTPLDGAPTSTGSSLGSDQTIRTKFEGTKKICENDPCAILSPSEGNIHEIVAEKGTGAFLDLLAPPYDHESRIRPCSYYEKVETISSTPETDFSNVVLLRKIRPPQDYWCDEVKYRGPDLNLFS